LHGQVDVVSDAVEDDFAPQRRACRVGHRQVIEAELVFTSRPQHEAEFIDTVFRDAEVGDGVNGGAENAGERLTRDEEVRIGIPERA
jgi:hypothetical protein